jgi:hypothetical protein
MVTPAESTDRLWRLLWSDAAHQIIERLHGAAGGEVVAVGYGWGLRRREEPQLALLLYPCAESRPVGDLALLIQGRGAQAIPRYGHSYPEYLAAVEDAVAAASADIPPPSLS